MKKKITYCLNIFQSKIFYLLILKKKLVGIFDFDFLDVLVFGMTTGGSKEFLIKTILF